MQFAVLSWTISGCETKSAGSYSTAEQPARPGGRCPVNAAVQVPRKGSGALRHTVIPLERGGSEDLDAIGESLVELPNSKSNKK